MIVLRNKQIFLRPAASRIRSKCAALLMAAGLIATSQAAVFTAREGDSPLEFTLPAYETTMVAIPADPIASAVYDRSLLDIQTDAASGMLYVLPKTRGSAMVYVTCRSGETAPLHLTFTEDAEPRTIILEKSVRKNREANAPVRVPSVPLRAEGFPAEMKRIVTLVLRGVENEEISRTAMTEPAPAAAAALKQLSPLRAKIEGIWRSSHAEAVEITLRNVTVRPIEIRPEALTGGSLWAAAATELMLEPGQTAKLVLVENARE